MMSTSPGLPIAPTSSVAALPSITRVRLIDRPRQRAAAIVAAASGLAATATAVLGIIVLSH